MGYPVRQYRRSGFQGAARTAGRGEFKIPRPANDNLPPLRIPWPANDNSLYRRRPLGPKRSVFRHLYKAFPYIRAANTIIRLTNKWLTYGQVGDLHGWTLGGNCNSKPTEGAFGPDRAGGGSSSNPSAARVHSYANSCLGNQGLPWRVWGVNPPHPKWELTWRIRPTSAGRGTVIESYWKPYPQNDPSVTYPEDTTVSPYEVPPSIYPIDPFTYPPHQPMPIYQPLPYEAIPYRPGYNPEYAPTEQPRRGTVPIGFEAPKRPPLDWVRVAPGVWPEIDLRPKPRKRRPPGDPPLRPRPPLIDDPILRVPVLQVEPGTETITTEPQKQPVLSPPRHRLAPPGKRTKERKVRIRAVAQGLRAIGVVTEFNDWLNALYDALPDHIRQQYHPKSPYDRFQILYRHINEVDARQAFENIILMEIEDRFYGKIGSISADASAASDIHHGLPIGFQAGKLF